ncbi:DNA processing protein DprA [Pedobacter lusitanus]|uniref:DNA processing protein DprA n=1 Tax=Pedobacter lusitanus TaxID=1503925 RepID=A0A0D0F0K7_9SPHI|nr:DNA-processing protein DprA [Pedobacter lusitanus]KIO75173.1 DNA processing protein DprA [Pedobacter lusitanus]
MSILHQIALTLIKNIGPVTAKCLLAHFHNPEAIFAAGEAALMQVEGLEPFRVHEILRTNALSLAAAQLTFLDQHQIEVLFYTDDKYPQRLKDCSDAPVLLYYKGKADLNHPRIVSIVGSRKATPYGLLLCQQLISLLQHYDVLVVSGLAYGIDVAAHRQSLCYKIPTVGVLGHGLDRVYPAAHRQTAGAMLESGGLLTEFPLNTIPEKGNFPKRNRVIAGLADVVVVVEAAVKGGALITAGIADSYHRDVFAFPGRTTDICSQGCNFLIKTNRAGLISQPEDLVYYMGWETAVPVNALVQEPLFNGLSAAEITLVKLLKAAPSGIDELGLKAGIQQHKLVLHLLNLEMKGVLISLPGKIYQLI